MWLIPSLKNEYVVVSFSDHSLVCSWIQKTEQGSASLILRAYKRYDLHNSEIYNLIPFNFTVIKKHILSFLQHYNLTDAFVFFCVDGPGMIEQFVAMPSSTVHRTDFDIAQTSSIHWQYRYIYPHDGQYIFYVYAVQRSLILQYQLLAMSVPCNIIALTTKTAALLEAYKNIFGIAFRKSQLSIDMIRYNNNVEDLISIDALRRMIIIDNSIDIKNEKIFIATAYGLFCQEKQ